MINKDRIKERILEARKIADKYELTNLSNEFNNLETINDEYKISVLFIGGYSAGKSALLNCVIGEEKLVENQAPETAIATELMFAEKESIYGVDEEGKLHTLNSLDNADVDKYNHVNYNINSDNLMKLEDYILVDTPGFDSGIERHNKALVQYIGKKGTAFVLVVDCERGTLSHSALNYLNEVSHYSTDIAVIINKCDKKTREDIEEIREHIDKLVERNCGVRCPIVTTSKYDEEVTNKIIDLIYGFNPQELYEKNVGAQVNNRVTDLVDALKIIEKNKTLDVSDIEDEIEKRERAKEKIIIEVQNQQKRVKQNLHDDVKNRIINNIRIKLNNNVRELADAYKISVESFQEKVVSMVRPIIIKSIEKYESSTYEKIIKGINVSDIDLGIDSEEIEKMLNGVLSKLQSVSSILADINTSKEEGKIDTSKFKAIMSLLAIATDIVAPVLELLIVFLPDVINIVKKLIGGNQDKKLVEEIQRNVIPKIVSKLEEELDNSLDTVEELMGDNIEESVAELIKVETDALEIAKKKKNDMENDYDKYIAEINSDIELFAN